MSDKEIDVLSIFSEAIQQLDVKALIALIVLVSSATSTVCTLGFQIWKQRRLEKLDHGATRGDLEVEKILNILLNGNKWPYRSFRMIRHNIGGYTDTELRRLLVRSGALRITSQKGQELWISSRVAKERGWNGGLLFNFPAEPDTPPEEGLFPKLHVPNSDLTNEEFEKRQEALNWQPKNRVESKIHY